MDLTVIVVFGGKSELSIAFHRRRRLQRTRRGGEQHVSAVNPCLRRPDQGTDI